MMVDRQFESFPGSQVIRVVVGFGVEQDREAVGLADLRSGSDAKIFLAKEFPPVNNFIHIYSLGKLWNKPGGYRSALSL